MGNTEEFTKVKKTVLQDTSKIVIYQIFLLILEILKYLKIKKKKINLKLFDN